MFPVSKLSTFKIKLFKLILNNVFDAVIFEENFVFFLFYVNAKFTHIVWVMTGKFSQAVNSLGSEHLRLRFILYICPNGWDHFPKSSVTNCLEAQYFVVKNSRPHQHL